MLFGDNAKRVAAGILMGPDLGFQSTRYQVVERVKKGLKSENLPLRMMFGPAKA